MRNDFDRERARRSEPVDVTAKEHGLLRFLLANQCRMAVVLPMSILSPAKSVQIDRLFWSMISELFPLNTLD